MLEVASLNLCDEIKNFVSLENRVEALEQKKPQTINVGAVSQPEVVIKNPTIQPDEKTLFGKLLVSLRKKNEVMLIALLGENTNFVLNNNVLTLHSSNEQEFKTLTKPDNLKILNDTMNEIENGVKVSVEFKEEKKQPSIEEMLKEKFGNDLKID